MPVFLDLHVGQGLTEEFVARAHQQDRELQDKFNCTCLTYWIDSKRGNGFCLIEAPNKEALIELHRCGHKKMPTEIIEVDKHVVKAFLGRVNHPEQADYFIDKKIKVFSEPAFRVVLLIVTQPPGLLMHELGNDHAAKMLREISGSVLDTISRHGGSAVESTPDAITATFNSVDLMYTCALDIKNMLNSKANILNLKIAAHGGNPVDGDPAIFGTTLKLLRQMCVQLENKGVNISFTVKELMEKSGIAIKSEEEEVRYLSPKEQTFLNDITVTLHREWQNSGFDMKDLRERMSMSKSNLYRSCVSLTGKSPNRILRDFRLSEAIQLLDNSDKSIAQIAFDTGFNSPSYFSRCFHKKFGINPRTYVRALQK